MAAAEPIVYKRKELGLEKAITEPQFGARTVLTEEPWTFVSLWLKRNHHSAAGIYWEQAREFQRAALDLPLRSAPLAYYYSFLNAVKALLTVRKIPFDPHHGVRAHSATQSKKISISNEGVRIQQKGILPAMCAHFGEPEPQLTHTLQEIFFNLPCIHRTYCLTYKSQKDLFVPVVNSGFVFDHKHRQAYLALELTKEVSLARIRLPTSLKANPSAGPHAVRSVDSVPWAKRTRPTPKELEGLKTLHRTLRFDLQYIAGPYTLWYVKARTGGPRRLSRSTLSLMYAAMHRLSEICRYKPIELESYLAGQKNWLLTEFINMTPPQFYDEIATEMTGYRFLVPNVRSPS